MSDPIDPALKALLPELAERHVAFLEARLVSDEARREFRDHLAAGWASLLATPVERLVDADAVASAIDSAVASPSFERTIRPIVEGVLLLETARLREEERPVGSYVPASARATIDELLADPDVVPERVLRVVLEHEAVEEVMRDVLHDALKEFSEKVNPFVADWGLPALLKRLGPFGFGGMGKSFDGMRAEFERRLEPEIRRFLQGFSRRALKKTTDVTVDKRGEPSFVALRREIAAWVLAQPVASMVVAHDDARARLGRSAALDIAAHVASETRAQRRAAIALAVQAHAKQTLGEALAVYGVSVEPDFEALAAASWPVVETLVKSEPVRAWLAKLTRAFYDTL
jgi:hypothetical protein